MKINALRLPNSIWLYLSISFVFSWSFWLFLILTTPPGVMQDKITPNFIVIAILGGFGPSIAGVLTIALVDGKTGLCCLLDRLRPPKTGFSWLLIALLFTPTVVVATLICEKALGLPTASFDAMLATIPVALIWPLFAALGEELGWRGYLLPELQKRYSSLASSFIVGIIWGLWHIPTVYLAYRQFGVWAVIAFIFVVHIFAIIAQSTAMTWIHNNTNNNLVLMIVFHFSLTGTALFVFPLQLPVIEGLLHQFIYGLFYWLAVGVVVLVFGRRLLTLKQSTR